MNGQHSGHKDKDKADTGTTVIIIFKCTAKYMYNFPNTQKYEEHQPKPDCVLKIPMHKEEHRLEHGLSIDLINMDPCLTADYY